MPADVRILYANVYDASVDARLRYCGASVIPNHPPSLDVTPAVHELSSAVLHNAIVTDDAFEVVRPGILYGPAPAADNDPEISDDSTPQLYVNPDDENAKSIVDLHVVAVHDVDTDPDHIPLNRVHQKFTVSDTSCILVQVCPPVLLIV